MVDRDVALKASSGVLMTAAAAAAAGSTPAVAGPADPPPPVPVSTWQGFYLGASVGASWLRSVQDDTAAISGITAVGLFGGQTTGGSTSTTNGIGWLGGLNLGYNWQSGNFVYSLEADFSWLGHTSASSNGAFVNTYTVHGYNIVAPGTTVRGSKVDWLGTFAARFGFDFNGTLPYLMLGVAGADIRNTFAISATSPFFGPSSSGSANQTSWTPGLVFGGGIEHKLNQNWSLRGEVEWIGFETKQIANPLFSTTYAASTSNHGPVSFSNDVVIARVGLNYRF